MGAVSHVHIANSNCERELQADGLVKAVSAPKFYVYKSNQYAPNCMSFWAEDKHEHIPVHHRFFLVHCHRASG